MKLKNGIFLLIGILVGWITVPLSLADSEGNTYKALLHRMIDIVTQIQTNTQLTVENTKAIREKLGAK